MENEHQKELSKILGLVYDTNFRDKDKMATWAEIYIAIGKLIEKANNPPVEKYIPTTPNYVQPCAEFHKELLMILKNYLLKNRDYTKNVV